MSNTNSSSKIYIIPNAISAGAFQSFNQQYYSQAIQECQLFFTEHPKTARRLLKTIIQDFDFDKITLIEWGKNPNQEAYKSLQLALKLQQNIGIISDAGLPGIADPGQEILKICHQHKAKVIPLVGPSAIFLALMASGCQGQRFYFHGYLPIEKSACIKYIKQMIADSRIKLASQIFIETPHRNNSLLQLLLQNSPAETLLCLAIDLESPTGFIQTKTIHQWKKDPPQLTKKPCTFILYME